MTANVPARPTNRFLSSLLSHSLPGPLRAWAHRCGENCEQSILQMHPLLTAPRQWWGPQPLQGVNIFQRNIPPQRHPLTPCGDPGLIKAPGQSEQSSGVSLVPTGGNTRSSISDVFLEWSSPSTSLFPPKFRPLLPLVQTIVLVWSTNALIFSLFKV